MRLPSSLIERAPCGQGFGPTGSERSSLPFLPRQRAARRAGRRRRRSRPSRPSRGRPPCRRRCHGRSGSAVDSKRSLLPSALASAVQLPSAHHDQALARTWPWKFRRSRASSRRTARRRGRDRRWPSLRRRCSGRRSYLCRGSVGRERRSRRGSRPRLPRPRLGRRRRSGQRGWGRPKYRSARRFQCRRRRGRRPFFHRRGAVSLQRRNRVGRAVRSWLVGDAVVGGEDDPAAVLGGGFDSGRRWSDASLTWRSSTAALTALSTHAGFARLSSMLAAHEEQLRAAVWRLVLRGEEVALWADGVPAGRAVAPLHRPRRRRRPRRRWVARPRRAASLRPIRRGRWRPR